MVILIAVMVIAASHLMFGSDVRLVVTLGVLFVVVLICFLTTDFEIN